MYIDIEIKSYAKDPSPIAEALASCIQHHDIADRIIVSSFDPRRVRRFHQVAARHGEKLAAIPGAAIYARTPRCHGFFVVERDAFSAAGAYENPHGKTCRCNAASHRGRCRGPSMTLR